MLETVKENPISFDDKKKANIVIYDAIMNLMPTRQRDNEDLTKYTKRFNVARDLCKDKYGGIFIIPMLTQQESKWGSDQETSYKTAYASFLSILCLKNMDQTKYGSFIRKMVEDQMSTSSTSRMHNMFCPSISMIKLIMISGRSNETIATKVTCPQRTKIIKPLGVYPI